MSKFEFIMMFVSVVVAFSMAELMMGWGRLIRVRQRLTRPLFMIGWSFWLLVLITFHYLGFWEYQVVDLRTVSEMLLVLSAPIVLVLITFVLTPEIRHFQRLDLEDHYFKIKNWFFSMAILFFLIAATSDVLLPDFSETWVSRMVGPLLIIPSLACLIFTNRRRVHYFVMFFNLFLLIVSSYAINVRAL